jgi:hypothetical protein
MGCFAVAVKSGPTSVFMMRYIVELVDGLVPSFHLPAGVDFHAL